MKQHDPSVISQPELVPDAELALLRAMEAAYRRYEFTDILYTETEITGKLIDVGLSYILFPPLKVRGKQVYLIGEIDADVEMVYEYPSKKAQSAAWKQFSAEYQRRVTELSHQ